MNTYQVNGYAPGVGNIGIVVSASSESAAAAAFRAQYPNAQVNYVLKVGGH